MIDIPSAVLGAFVTVFTGLAAFIIQKKLSARLAFKKHISRIDLLSNPLSFRSDSLALLGEAYTEIAGHISTKEREALKKRIDDYAALGPLLNWQTAKAFEYARIHKIRPEQIGEIEVARIEASVCFWDISPYEII